MNCITVFCGSSRGTDPVYTQHAEELGKRLAQRRIALVYGGAKVGLMGAVATGALSQGGKVTGVLPHFLSRKEIAHEGLTKLILVASMHERKTQMNALSDGVIALPGGYGTLEELFEMLTWAQLGLHQKPVALLNINGFYDSLLVMIENMVDKGLLKDVNRQMLLVSDDIDDLLSLMENYVPPKVTKWISDETN